MREIEFRGKNAKNEWVTGDLLRNRGETFICPDGLQSPFATPEDFRVDPATVGQFTGLTDKNGREIYEGDVLSYEKADGKSLRGFVKYTLDGFDVWRNGRLDFSLRGLCRIKVIGSIHDNPKLLNNESDDSNS